MPFLVQKFENPFQAIKRLKKKKKKCVFPKDREIYNKKRNSLIGTFSF